MTRPQFATDVLGATDEYRLDIVTDPGPDIPQVVSYFTASDPETASRQAQRLLAAVDGPDDRYGELYAHDGDGGAVHSVTIHLPE
ncbi:hypothetical protein [Micromonospora sp. CA-246542]|uniref:hypothetical protein n=1 Tax=Micromonospora sp. CA-246542 TaxID=3239959 RepID=UPI003D9135E4